MIQKQKDSAMHISFVFSRPLYPLCQRVPSPCIALLEPLIPFALELIPMPIRYLTQCLQ